MSSVSQRAAVVLVSGGLDSATVLACAKADGFTPYALTFDYGQRHRFELEAARKVCESVGVARQVVLNLDLRPFGGSALTSEIAVPKDRAAHEMEIGIPITYVPARNTVFLSLAMGWAEALGAADIYIGVNAVDYSGYPDCRPEFIASFQQLAQLATKAGVEGSAKWNIHTPLIELTKAQIIQLGRKLGIDYQLTHSCYDPAADGRPCGHCDACLLRLKGFADAGLTDPVEYAPSTP